ncbi:MAG: hypothetical protein Q4C95_09655 [Planctomycetia bacterium]|nr:hypothetical protein [Planctomycetia bacterium]
MTKSEVPKRNRPCVSTAQTFPISLQKSGNGQFLKNVLKNGFGNNPNSVKVVNASSCGRDVRAPKGFLELFLKMFGNESKTIVL